MPPQYMSPLHPAAARIPAALAALLCVDDSAGGHGLRGAIAPTLYLAALHLDRGELAQRAERAALEDTAVQLPSGAVAVSAGTRSLGAVVSTTGQALLGWLCAFAHTGWGVFAGAARRAGRFLTATLDDDGLWRGARCNASAAWALAEAGRRLGAPEFRAAAAQHFRAVARHQDQAAWLPGAMAGGRPLAEVAGAIRGLLEGGRVLGEGGLITRAALAAEAVADLESGGSLPGGPLRDGSVSGAAQMANVWLRLGELTAKREWLEPAAVALRLLATCRDWQDPELNASTRLLVDAAIRRERAALGRAEETTDAAALA